MASSVQKCIPGCGGRKVDNTSSITAPPLWIGEIASQVKTGDVLLTSNKDQGAKIIKFFTRSEWNHVGMVIKPSANRAYLVEWGGGLFACELNERLVEYAEWDAVDLVIRRLTLPEGARRATEERMEKFVDMLFRENLGQNRAVPLNEVLKAARDQLFSKSSSYGAEDVYTDDLTNLFCSKTIAVVYKAAGLLKPNRQSDKFLPKHFAVAHNDFLDLQNGAYLGPEQRITFESKALRDGISLVMELPVIDVVLGGAKTKQEEKAAMLVQKFVRRVAARREMSRRKAIGLRATKNEMKKDGALYRGAKEVGTKERTAMLKSQAKPPKPSSTVGASASSITETGPTSKDMLI